MYSFDFARCLQIALASSSFSHVSMIVWNPDYPGSGTAPSRLIVTVVDAPQMRVPTGLFL